MARTLPPPAKWRPDGAESESPGSHPAIQTSANRELTMRWNLDTTERWAELVRFAVKCAFTANIIMLAVFSIWFTAMLLWRLQQYFWKCWLGHPW